MRSNSSGPPMGAPNQLESLSWVLEEVRKSAGIAVGALSNVLTEKPTQLVRQVAGATTSPSNLKTAYSELRRASGALRMVGQEVSAEIFADIATILDRSMRSPEIITEQLLKSVKSICFAVNAYLSGVMYGRTWPTTVLFTVAQTAAGLAGRLAFHPAQLWIDKGKSLLGSVTWNGLDTLKARQAQVNGDLSLLRLLKGELAAAEDLIGLCASKGMDSKEPGSQTLAYSGALFFHHLCAEQIPFDLYAKRTAGKLTQWLTSSVYRENVSLGLLHEVKYFLSRIETANTSEEIHAIRSLHDQGFLANEPTQTGVITEFRVVDPEQLEEAQKHMHASKADWSKLTNGDLSVGAAAVRHFSALHHSMLKFWPELAVVTASLGACIQTIANKNQVPSAGLSLEVATALLFLEDALVDPYSSDDNLKEKAQALFARLEKVNAGSAPLELQDWMEALFRRSGEKQTMGNVAGELHHLSLEIERLFETIFSGKPETSLAASVQKLQGLLVQMKGVLGVIGLEHGVSAAAHLRAITNALERDINEPHLRPNLIGNIGSNMASLGLMIDMLSYQPSLANRLFQFDVDTGTLTMPTHAQSTLPESIGMEKVDVYGLKLSGQATVKNPSQSSQVGGVDNFNSELKGVFAQEAQDVVEEGLDSISALALNAKDIDMLISLRRGFHTLKGSARMVGMNDLGNAAWAMEQLLNEQLTNKAKPVSANLCALARDALGIIGQWSDLLGQGQDPGWTAEPFNLAADAIRRYDRYQTLQMPMRPNWEKTELGTQAHPKGPTISLDLSSQLTESVMGADNGTIKSDEGRSIEGDAQEASVEWGAVGAVEALTFDDLDPVSDFKLGFETQQVPTHTLAQVDADTFDFNLESEQAAVDTDQFKVIGPLKIRFNLYNVFLQESDEISRAMEVSLSEWLLESHHALPEQLAQYAHTLAGSSATVGFDALADLCRTLETVFANIGTQSHRTIELAEPLTAGVEAVRFLLHQFAAGFLKQPDPSTLLKLKNLAADEGTPLIQNQPMVHEADAQRFEQTLETLQDGQFFDSVHTFSDQEIWDLFTEEAGELIPHISRHLHDWLEQPASQSDRAEVLRGLHTLKGSARLAGAMHLGDSIHAMEAHFEALEPGDRQAVKVFLEQFDRVAQALDSQAGHASLQNVETHFERTEDHKQPSSPENVEKHVLDQELAPKLEPLREAESGSVSGAVALVQPVLSSEIGELVPATNPARLMRAENSDQTEISPTLRQAPVRVNARLLDALMNRAGEVMGSRARIKLEVDQFRTSLVDLDANVDKLRSQLREIEIQAESQMQSRLALHKEADAQFDPLEFDRFTRVQELTRMMAESVNDVATVQRNLQRSIYLADDGLVAQGRQARELQRELLRTRMVPFDAIAQRLHRTARQAARDAGKSVHLEVEGGNLELDRQQLDRLGPSLEHLIRNAVAHGVETQELRSLSGKSLTGLIQVSVRQDRNDILVEIRDDGRGLDVEQITKKAVAAGLVSADLPISAQQAFELICLSGFTTASKITELAGRGIGMDVVKSSVEASGGRMEALSLTGQGLTVRLVLPLTTATTQVLLVRHGAHITAIPVNMVEQVLRFNQRDLQQAYGDAAIRFGDETIPFFWSGALLGMSRHSDLIQFRTQAVVVVRSAGRRVAMHVDETIGQQEVIVKSVGGQLASLPGLTGVSVLPSGSIVLIYNPVALALVYGDQIAQFISGPIEAGKVDGAGNNTAHGSQQGNKAAAAGPRPILVVDDSITVRRVTQRLLERAGYRVALAGDGVQALDLLRGELAQDLPFIVLADIEMPRMDGFDLVRSLSGDARLASIPVVMITSRLAEKHREMATRLGVKHYLGKPFAEDHLLALVAQYKALADSPLPSQL